MVALKKLLSLLLVGLVAIACTVSGECIRYKGTVRRKEVDSGRLIQGAIYYGGYLACWVPGGSSKTWLDANPANMYWLHCNPGHFAFYARNPAGGYWIGYAFGNRDYRMPIATSNPRYYNLPQTEAGSTGC